MPVIPLRKILHPLSTVINVLALLTKFQGQIATAMMVRMKHPLRILIQRGHRAAISIPVDMALRTIQSAIWDARKQSPEKKVPARVAGDMDCDWM
tara:strand:- start:249 stop:533 length:285 start_codon:yes stop_codon:yes gene_type:complete